MPTTTDKKRFATGVTLTPAKTPPPKFGTREYARWLTLRIDQPIIDKAERQGAVIAERRRWAQIRAILNSPVD